MDTTEALKTWLQVIRGPATDADIRAQQIGLLERAITRIQRRESDPAIAAELEAWAMAQEATGQYPTMSATMRAAAQDLLFPARG
ncbi:hypothetical protein Ms3S1_14540 [Methylosinus sp. 3S-1]